MIASYPSIYTLGHRYLSELFSGPVVIQEKIDGSQFSFGVINGKLHCRSKGTEIHAPEGMFAAAVATATRCFYANLLPEGHVFRCEYLGKPKHNVLAYGRVPAGNLVLFDVCCSGENYLPTNRVTCWAGILEIEPVPVLYEGTLCPQDAAIQHCLDRESVLGGCKIEGIVVKNYNRFGIDKKILVGKFVSPEFKEVHRHAWPKDKASPDIVEQIIADYKTSPRWCKAIQHLREKNLLVGGPEDIGALIREVQDDVASEAADEIRVRLFTHFWPQIRRGITDGLAQWYKQRLADGCAIESAFDDMESISKLQST